MIELRWHERNVKDLRPATNVYPHYPRETVLQYRTQVMQIGNGYSTDAKGVIHQYERPMGMSWSEWKDVPTEKEPMRYPSQLASGL